MKKRRVRLSQDKEAFDRMWDKVMRDVYSGVNDWLSENLDFDILLKMAESMRIPGTMSWADKSAFDPYTVLGLNKDATNDEVKQRYKDMMKKLHPDVAGSEMTFVSKIVNAAYEMIKLERRLV